MSFISTFLANTLHASLQSWLSMNGEQWFHLGYYALTIPLLVQTAVNKYEEFRWKRDLYRMYCRYEDGQRLRNNASESESNSNSNSNSNLNNKSETAIERYDCDREQRNLMLFSSGEESNSDESETESETDSSEIENAEYDYDDDETAQPTSKNPK
jgi:hypothetical protein